MSIAEANNEHVTNEYPKIKGSKVSVVPYLESSTLAFIKRKETNVHKKALITPQVKTTILFLMKNGIADINTMLRSKILKLPAIRFPIKLVTAKNRK